MKYDFKKIEKRWQAQWRKEGVHEPDLDKAKRPFYNLMMFPYPSAEGLHVGNVYAFTGSDVYGRYQRMRGNDVFEPIGLDGFGIHSENYAIKTNTHPLDLSKKSEKRFYEQLEGIGNGFSWQEKVETYNPNYYRWTQWIFLELFKNGLAYRKKAPVNWCPSCKTVLADEQVLPAGKQGLMGKCERCDSVVKKKDLEQWFFRITKYADKLLKNLEMLDWSEKVKIAQKNWIGKSEGAFIQFKIPASARASAGRQDSGFKNSRTSDVQVVFASNNRGKVKRLEKIFKAAGIPAVIKTPREIGISDFEVEEDGKTLAENAEKKARAIATRTNLPVLADDTGFFIDGLQIDPHAVKRNALKGGDEKSLTVEQIGEKMLAYYQGIARSRGGKVDAEWRNALCLIMPGMPTKIIEAVRPVILTETPHGTMDPYLPVRPLYIPKATGTYALFQTEKEELKEFEPMTEAVKELFTPSLTVFTTRPDTLFGATFLVLSPELAKSWIENGWRAAKEVRTYVEKSLAKSREERVNEKKGKTGVDTGLQAINPANGKEISVWVADYVLGEYGTSAIMAVPAHDERDFEFAKRFTLPIQIVVCPHYPAKTCPVLDTAYEGEGHLVDSGKFDGLDSEKAKWEITKFVGGKRETHYRLRDWLISRQRYWGPPIPLIFCENCKKSVENLKSQSASWRTNLKPEKEFSKGEIENPGWIGVSEKDLPIELPYVKDFRPKGKGDSPLASAKSFVNVKCPKCGKNARRETDVSDTFLDSSWYFMAYLMVGNWKLGFGSSTFAERIRRWLPVHMYIGGAEHSVLHLLYTRFITMALKDLGHIDFEEPFKKFSAHGLIIKGGAKMSKSKGNIVNPDFYLKEFGADALRMYLMFLAPFEDGGDFQENGILGPVRFLERVWRMAQQVTSDKSHVTSQNMHTFLQKTIQKVTRDIETLNYNTALSALMILLNEIEKSKEISYDDFLKFIKLLNPFAPHLAQEIWDMLGEKTFIDREAWPAPEKIEAEGTFKLIIQINGKVRDAMDVPTGISKDDALQVALKSEKVKKFVLDASKIKNVIFVPNRILNIVV